MALIAGRERKSVTMRKLICALFCFLIIGSGLIPRETQNLKRTKTVDNVKTERNLIQSINFRSTSKDWSALCTYYADGRVEGAHLSGNPPFVHQDKSTISKAAVNELWQAAVMVCRESFPKAPKPNSQWTVYEQIVIIRQNDNVQIMWQTSPEKQDPGLEVKKLVEVILKYHIGGW